MKIISNIYNELLPESPLSNTVLAVLPVRDYQSELVGIEKEAADHLNGQRKAEFTAGRNIARRILGELNIPHASIGRTAQGAPIWPDTVCGSISHKRDYCAVIIGKKGEITGLGVDIERHEQLSKGVWKTFVTEQELGRISCPGMNIGEKANLVFSAKESAYKCFSNFDEDIAITDIKAQITTDNSLISVSCRSSRQAAQGMALRMGGYVVVCLAKYNV